MIILKLVVRSTNVRNSFEVKNTQQNSPEM
jgi:hypothetical protein